MTKLKTMKVSVNDIHEVSDLFKNCFEDIIEIIKNLSLFEMETPIKLGIKHNDKSFTLSFHQTVLMALEEAAAISDEFQIPVRKIDIALNDHQIGWLNLTASDVINGLKNEDEEYIKGFILSRILNTAFHQWYQPNIAKPGFDFSDLNNYNSFIKTMLKPVGYDTQLSWDGKIFNLAIFSEEPYEIKVQQTHYCHENGYLDEEFFLGNMRSVIQSVFFELFRKKQLGNNIMVEINDVD